MWVFRIWNGWPYYKCEGCQRDISVDEHFKLSNQERRGVMALCGLCTSGSHGFCANRDRAEQTCDCECRKARQAEARRSYHGKCDAEIASLKAELAKAREEIGRLRAIGKTMVASARYMRSRNAEGINIDKVEEWGKALAAPAQPKPD